MPWTQRYSAVFTSKILDQLIAIIQRDQAAAIASVDSTLDQVTEFHKGPGPRMATPYLTLLVDSIDFDQGSWDTRHSIARLALHLDVGSFDQEDVVIRAYKYALVLDRIITTSAYGDLTDFTTALAETYPAGVTANTTPPAAGTVKDVFVLGHRFGVSAAPERETPLMRVTLELLVEMEET